MSKRLALFALIVLLVFATSAKPAFAYEAPVDGPIIDPWRPPIDEYGAGDRGVDFQTRAGTPVLAADGGVVSFAGQVGGQNFVVIQHRDGLRTTYGGLAAVLVGAGQAIGPRTSVGLSGLSLHFGVRRGEEYLDPMSILDAKAHLVPLDAPNAAARAAISDAAFRWVTGGVAPSGSLNAFPVSAHPRQASVPRHRQQREHWISILAVMVGLGATSVASRRLVQRLR